MCYGCCWYQTLLGHFDGTTKKPLLFRSPSEEQKATLSQWEKNEQSSKSLLTQNIPDLTLMKVHNMSNVRDRWALTIEEYTEKGTYAQTDLHTQFLALKCKDKDNVHSFSKAVWSHSILHSWSYSDSSDFSDFPPVLKYILISNLLLSPCSVFISLFGIIYPDLLSCPPLHPLDCTLLSCPLLPYAPESCVNLTSCCLIVPVKSVLVSTSGPILTSLTCLIIPYLIIFWFLISSPTTLSSYAFALYLSTLPYYSICPFIL